MLEQQLVIACATDDGFAPHCGTMLQSLLKQSAHQDSEIHILHGQQRLSQDQTKRLRQVVERVGASVLFHEISEEQIQRFPRDRFHEACWYRILLPELLPDTKRILYLDADILITDTLIPLWETNLQGRILGAVTNPLYPFMKNRGVEVLGLAHARDYLNSGVLLMDLVMMRQVDLVSRIEAYANANPGNIWPEQDALSVLLQNDGWLTLHPRWNVQNTLYELRSDQLPLPKAQIDEALQEPAIVHFIGPFKPWHFLCRHPRKALYAEVRKETPWQHWKLEGKTALNRAIRLLPYQRQLQVLRWKKRLQAKLLRVFSRWAWYSGNFNE